MIRECVVVAVFSLLTLPALAADSTPPTPVPEARTERTADSAADATAQEVSPATPSASTVPAQPGTIPEAIPPVTASKDATQQVVPASRVSSPPDFSPMLYGLLVVLALMAGAVWLMKRLGMVRAGAASVGRVVGGISLGNRERLVVVEIADQWIVVGVAPGRVNALAQLPRQDRGETQSDSASAAPDFSTWLKQTMDRRNGNNVNNSNGNNGHRP